MIRFQSKSPAAFPVSILLLALLTLFFSPDAFAERYRGGKQKSAGKPASKPVVHAVLFWMEGCSHCVRLKEKVLPPIHTKYGDKLKIKLIEIENSHDEDLLYKIGASHKLEEDEIGVPLLMYGNQILVGDRDIERKFPEAIDRYLASGGLPFPDNPLLMTYLASPRPVEAPPPKAKAKEEESVRTGLLMAAVIAVIMIAALASTSISFLLPENHGNRFLVNSPWPDRLIPLLCIMGIGVAGYLTKIEYSGGAPFCGAVQGCDKVQSSEYAWIIKDVLPVGLLGLAAYISMLAAWIWGRFSTGTAGHLMRMGIFVSASIGILYSIYLTWIELFVLKAACIWCLLSANILTLILILSLPAARKSRYCSGLLKPSRKGV